MEKPRIFRKYYPSLKRGFWKVSPMAKPYNELHKTLWGAAHSFVQRLNREQ